MYLEQFGLRERPFSHAPDERFDAVSPVVEGAVRASPVGVRRSPHGGRRRPPPRLRWRRPVRRVSPVVESATRDQYALRPGTDERGGAAAPSRRPVDRTRRGPHGAGSRRLAADRANRWSSSSGAAHGSSQAGESAGAASPAVTSAPAADQARGRRSRTVPSSSASSRTASCWSRGASVWSCGQSPLGRHSLFVL